MIKLRTAAVVAGAVLFGGSLIACGGNPSPGPTATHSASPTTKPPVTPTSRPPVSPTSKPTSKPTQSSDSQGDGAEQRNATRAAMDYLAGQNFSRTGLIKQLNYEGYSVKSSTAAVDSLHMDWNEQAALVARDYLQEQAFSRKSLTDQLKFEGFTSGQAAYGVSKSGL